MPRGLSPELAAINPHLTVTVRDGINTSCDLLGKSKPCQQAIPGTRYFAKDSEVRKFIPPIISCADCPVARNSKK